MCLFLAVLGLCCCGGRLSSSVESWELLCSCRLLVAEHGLWAGGFWALEHVGSSQIRAETPALVSCIGSWILYHWATREAVFHFILKISSWVLTEVFLKLNEYLNSFHNINEYLNDVFCYYFIQVALENCEKTSNHITYTDPWMESF